MPPWSAPLYIFSVLLCLVIYVVLRYRAGPYAGKPNPVLVAALVLGCPALGLAAAILAHVSLSLS